MSDCQTGCGRPAGDAFVCRACGDTLAADLAAVPDLAADLDVTLTRQGRTGLPVGNTSGSPRKPLPFDERASAVLTDLRAILVGWVRLCVEEGVTGRLQARQDASQPFAVGDSLPMDTFRGLAAFLAARVEALRFHPAGSEAVHEIGQVVARGRRVVDVPEARWYAGPCACGRDLYARVRASAITCQCGQTYDVQARRDELLGQVEDRLATATEISRAVTTLGHQVTPAAIRGYVHRGRLQRRTNDQQGRPLYRVGDVLTLVLSVAGVDSR